MRFETGAWTEAVDFVGWVLLHSLWQGIVLAIAVAAALVLLRERSAAVRYAVAYAGLLLLLVLPAVTTWLTVPEPEPVPRAASAAAVERTPASEGGAAAGSDGAAKGAALAGRAATLLSEAVGGLDPLLPWLVGGWLLGVAVLSVRLAGGWLQIRLLRRRAAAGPAPWQRVFRDLRRRLAVGRPVRLAVSARLRVPVACGWLRPMVVVPVSMLSSLPPAQVETILAHELAHIRRNDYPFNLLQGVIEILLFYHPAVWYVSGRVREERENCCDDLAVTACGDPRVVARALAGLEELRSGALGSPALAATGGPLLARVRRLLAPPPPGAGEAAPRFAAVAVLTATLSLVVLPAALNALPAAPAGISDPARPLVSTAFSFEDEVRVERACEEWERVRRCVDPQGHGRFECVPGSPLAAMLAPFREPRRQDAEVRVEVRRPASREVPDGDRSAALPAIPDGVTGTVEVRRVVGELPTCRGHR